MNTRNAAAPGAAVARPLLPALAPAPTLRSEHLLRGGREVVIRHGDTEYRLRHTRNGKLILTK